MELPATRAEALAAGAAHYFTGKPCKYGHISKRYAAGPCFTCQKLFNEKLRRTGEANRHRREWWKKRTPEQIQRVRDTRKKWRQTPAAFTSLLSDRLRCRIYKALKAGAAEKHGKTVALLGCTIPKYKKYLEKKFLPGMTWENHGPVWHIDHVIPVSRFNLATLKGQKAAFNYKNTQPLWAEDNLRKGAR